MSALALPTMGADGPEKWDPSSGVQYSTLLDKTKVQTDNAGNTYLDVFYYEGYETSKYNWYGDLVIGDSGESKGHVDNVGAFVDNWEWVTPTASVKTADLNVQGNVTVQGNGKVVLGGNFNDTRYLGIEATGITVNGGSLTATKITAKDLVVTGGTVSTSTIGCNQGSAFYGGYNYSYIQNSLTISGGSLSFGYAGDDIEGIDSNRDIMTAFGNSSFSMTQTGGTMNVYGAVILTAGATITQEDNAGATVLRDTVFMQGSGTTTFTQSADSATLVIGKLGRAQLDNNEQNIVFNQSGDGLIHLAYGSNFKQESTISLNQTGSGVINIGGGHDTALTGALPTNYALDQTTFESSNTTYNIDQSGAGTVNVNGALTADTVKVGGESKLNINEDVTVNTLTQSGTAEITVAEDKTLVVNGLTISGGVFANKGIINGVVSLAESAEGEPITITDGQLVNSGTINATVTMSGGTLVAEAGSEIAGITATGGDILVEGDFTMTGDMILDGDAELIFGSADYTIDLGEYDVVFSGNSSIALTLGDADISGVVLFTGAKEDYSGYKVTLLNEEGQSTGTAVLEYNADGTVTLGTAAVPEPTSSMLGLMGLVAFTLRRRRK